MVNNSSYVFCLVVDADGFAPLHMILVAPIMVEIANEKKSVWNTTWLCILLARYIFAGCWIWSAHCSLHTYFDAAHSASDIVVTVSPMLLQVF